MPAQFQKLGIAFQYPENWTLDESDARAGQKSVTVYSPGGAFWSVALHPHWADPAGLAKGVVDAMKEEYADIEAEEIEETIAGHELVGFDLSFYYLDLTNSARVRGVRIGQNTYTVFCQGDDREFARVEAVFRAMTTSLVSGRPKSQVRPI
jgi:hypothetical protein